MSETRAAHLIERAVERMAELGLAPAGAPIAPHVPPNLPPEIGGDLPAEAVADARADAADLLPPPEQPSAKTPGNAAPAADGARLSRPDDKSTAKSAEKSGGKSEGAPASAAAAAPAAARVAAPIVDMAALEASGMVVASGRRSRASEEWNVTASRLLRVQRTIRRNPASHSAANLLMITSSKPNEGKSFSALNLAGSLTLGGMAEVLLIDTDSKPGALSQLLGVGDRLGLFDMVTDPSLRLDDLILTTAIPNLTVLPIGRAARGGAGSTERTVTRPVVMAIENAARRFPNRVVILDSAPCLATSDAVALAGTVGQIAMIVEAERTQRDDLEAALELLRPCANITLVLNKVRQITTHAFGDYDYYNG